MSDRRWLSEVRQKTSIMKVILIGSGRVGFHLGMRLDEVGIEVIQVFSRELKKAKKLAQSIDSEPINNLKKVSISIFLIQMIILR